MKDLAIALEHRPGALSEVGEALGRAGVSIEGGGAWLVGGQGVAHLLFADGTAARRALVAASIRVLDERDVLIQRLNQDEPGQLGKILRKMAEAGVNIEAFYSDHKHQLVLVVDDMVKDGLSLKSGCGNGKSAHHRIGSEFLPGACMRQHTYDIQVNWTGNDGQGTKTYKGYRRDHTIGTNGKPLIEGSSDPAFRGDRSRYNPEELLVASLSSCHMLWYLHLCAMNHLTVLEYRDAASGAMQEHDDGSGEFVRVTLRPVVVVCAGDDQSRAAALHEEAHRLCFVARSVNFPVEVSPKISAMSATPSG